MWRRRVSAERLLCASGRDVMERGGGRGTFGKRSRSAGIASEGRRGQLERMHLVTTPEEQRAWMAQWRSAASALERVKMEELSSLTDEGALRDSDDLLSLGPFE